MDDAPPPAAPRGPDPSRAGRLSRADALALLSDADSHLAAGEFRDAAMRYGTGVGEGDHFSEWAPSVVVKAPISQKINVHTEYFGIFTSDKEHDDAIQYVSPGVHYLITPDLEVGVRVGWGLNDQSARFFSNVGFGWRF